jgi:hypothetical protein
MRKRKSTALYRNFLSDAWRLTWERKSLWIFGIFAGIISTGGVVDVVFRSMKRVEGTSTLLQDLLESGFIGYGLIGSYFQQLAALGGASTGTLVTVVTLASVLLIAVGILAQGSLALGIKSKTHIDPHTLRASGKAHFWPLVLLALLMQVVMAILLMLMTLALFFVSMHASAFSLFVYVALMVLLIPAIIIVNIIYMFSVLDVVHNDVHPMHAMEHGWKLFKKQWLSSLEFGLLLFLITFFVGIGIMIGLLLLMLPYAIIFTGTLLSGSFTLFLVANITFGLALVLLALGVGGGVVTYQYAAWYQFYKRALHKTHGKKHFSKVLRVLKK